MLTVYVTKHYITVKVFLYIKLLYMSSYVEIMNGLI